MVLSRAVLQAGVKSAAVTADRLRPRRRGVVVLIYHRVGAGSTSDVDLPVATFRQQMDELAASGRVRDLDTALDAMAGEAPVGPDPVVVTFDDGTADFVDHALPVLVEFGIPALLYVATSFVEAGVPFLDGEPMATWAGLAECRSTGLVDIGSHTHRHLLLDRLPSGEVGDELDRSIDLIGARLGEAPRHFAYPKAVAPSPAAEAEVRRRFVSASLAGTRPNPYGATDPHRLWRSPVQHSDGLRWFRAKVDGGMAAEDTLRRVANRARYRSLTA